MSDGNLKMDEVRSTGHLASLVLNHPMTHIIKTCQKMSLVELVCDVSSNCNLWSCAKLRGFWSAFWDGRTYATLSGMSHCHTT